MDRHSPGSRCSDPSPAPAPSGCEGARDMMGSDLDINPMRYTDDGKVNPWDIELPQTFLGPPGGEEPTCMIMLNVTGQEWLTPAKMWQAAVPVNAVCARRGQQGLILGLGLLFLQTIA